METVPAKPMATRPAAPPPRSLRPKPCSVPLERCGVSLPVSTDRAPSARTTLQSLRSYQTVKEGRRCGDLAVYRRTRHVQEGAARPLGIGWWAVSYTHLRAHETGRNLVCRLLLEKKK